MNFPFNDVKGDVYVGKGCGKMIYDDIVNAQKRVCILSPYVDLEYIELLKRKFQQGLEINCLKKQRFDNLFDPYIKSANLL